MPSIPELTRVYLAAHQADADAKQAKTDAYKALKVAEAELVEAMSTEGVTRSPVDGRMVSWKHDLSATIDVAVPPEVLVDSLESLGLGDLVQRNAVSVHAGALAAALRGLEREAAERGEDLPEIEGVKVRHYTKVLNAKGSS